MKLLSTTRGAIVRTDPAIAAAVAKLLDRKTKPRNSLGRLEWLACRIAAIRHPAPAARGPKAVIVMGADHGVACEGVSAYPQEVTAQMLMNFDRGGAAINVLARQVGARVHVVDMGVAHDLLHSTTIHSRKIARGTANLATGPAMTPEQAVASIEVGIDEASKLMDDGVILLGIGEMGIGNSTAASAVTAALSGRPVDVVTGRGTGLDDLQWRHKVNVVERALELNKPDPANAIDVLAKLGGFELGGLCGATLAAAARRVPVVLDGFIASVAAWLAVRLCPAVADYLIASHRSVEAGHAVVLEALDQVPLFDLELRLGEGTGAALAMPIVDSALAILSEMATFDSAGVSDSGA